MIPPEQYEIWRRFLPYVLWSSRIIDIWNEAVHVKSSILYASPERVKEMENSWTAQIETTRLVINVMCDSIKRSGWSDIAIDIIDIPRAESREWLEYYVSPEIDFDTLCININLVLDDAIEELEEKIIVKNKLVALHKRWFYDSKRGRGHDISIEIIATVVIPGNENKEDYEKALEQAMKEHLYGQEGFEQLEEVLSEELLGFEEVETDEAIRGIKVEEITWDHRIVERQLDIKNFLE
jgi:hypothetical protein